MLSLLHMGVKLPKANVVKYQSGVAVRSGEILAFDQIKLLCLEDTIAKSNVFNHLSKAQLGHNIGTSATSENFYNLNSDGKLSFIKSTATGKFLVYDFGNMPDFSTLGMTKSTASNKWLEHVSNLLITKNFSTFVKRSFDTDPVLLIARGESGDMKNQKLLKSATTNIDTITDGMLETTKAMHVMQEENKSLKADVLRLKTLMIDELGIDATKVTGIDVDTTAVKRKAKEDADGIERSMDTDPSHLAAQEQARIDRGEK